MTIIEKAAIPRSPMEENSLTIYVAMAANILIALTKFIVAFLSGSSAMLSEAIHSTVDTGNEILLLFGIYCSKKPADPEHPYGHGQELYFWGLIVAILLFGIGGGMSVYEGLIHLQHPVQITNPMWNYIVLGIAFLADGFSWIASVRKFLRAKKPNHGLWRALRTSTDPAVYIILGEDTADLLGIIVAFLGVFLGQQLKNPALDGLASMLIGCILGAVSIFLVIKSKELLVGESADRDVVEDIRYIVSVDPAVQYVQQPMTMYLAPRQILVNLTVEFKSDLSVHELTEAIERLDRMTRDKLPQIRHLFIEARSISRTKDFG